MPQIPQFVGKRELNVESPNVKVNPSDFGVKGKVGAEGEALSKVGNTLMQIGEKFQEIKDENEFTSAQVNTQKRLNDLYIKKQNDPDIWSAGDKLQEEIDKIHTEESEKIGNQLVKNRFSADFQMRAMSYTNKIQDDLRQKQHESMSATAMDFINGEKENYYNAGTPADRALAMENINIKINEMSGRGIWNAQATQKFREEIKTEINVGLATSDMNLDPKSALIELKKGKEGAYPDIPHDQRLKLTDMAENQILKDEKIAERNLIIAKNQAESDNLDAYLDITQSPEGVEKNKMTTDLIDKVNKQVDAKLVDPKHAIGIVKALNSPTTVNAKHDVMVYDELMTDISRSDLSATEIRTKILNARAAGKLTDGDVNHLLYVEKGTGDTSVQEEYLADVKKSNRPKSKVWSTAWSLIKGSTSGMSFGPGGAVVSAIMNKTIGRAKSENATGERIVEIAKEEVDKNVKESNPNKTKYAIGDYVPLPNGKLFKVSGFTSTGAPTGKIVSGKSNTE
jgi:hypothetical protein